LPALLFNSTLAQQKISGTVLNEANVPLPGTTVSLKNSTISTITGDDGSFSLQAKKGDILEISFIGYKTQQIKVVNESALKVSLELAMNSLDEVVVTGYTSQRIKEITGSVAVVKTERPTLDPCGPSRANASGKGGRFNCNYFR
jgi:hypothetical protein